MPARRPVPPDSPRLDLPDSPRLDLRDPAELAPPPVPATFRLVDARCGPDGSLVRFDPLVQAPPPGALPDASWPRLEWDWSGLGPAEQAQVEAWVAGRAPLPREREWGRIRPRFVREPGPAAPARGALGAFLTLAAPRQAPDPTRDQRWQERVLDFARRWGPLGVCRHGLPGSHVVGLDEHLRPQRCPRLAELAGARYQEYEPLGVWLAWARQARAALALAADLAEGRPGQPTDWKTLGPPGGPAGPASAWGVAERLSKRGRGDPRLTAPAARLRQAGLDPLALARNALDRYVGRWLRLAGAAPALWRGGDGQGCLTLDVGPGAFGRLALQLAQVVVAGRARRCGVCGRVEGGEAGDRRPRSDRRHLCSPACREDARRARQRDYQRRRRAARRRLDEATHP